MSAGARVLAVTTLLCGVLRAPAYAESLDSLEDTLAYESAGGRVRLQGSGLLDLEAYYIDQLPPGLIFGDDDNVFLQPRLTLFLDAFVGDRLYAFVQTRADRGFDPGLEDPDARFDEYFVRFSPLADERIAVQAGKFATVVGNFVERHHSWDNPMTTAPLPYENVTTVSDNAAPASTAVFLSRRDDADKKHVWVPVVWGPSYASGGSVSGRLARVSYALEVKNAALSSRPSVWDDYDARWGDPTVSARLGYEPAPPWSLGVSASRGSYLRPGAEDALGAGKDIGDFPQTTIATDLAYSSRRWRAWSEVFLSRFDVPNVGDLDTLAYYVEAQFQPGARWYLGARWNQQLFEEIRDATGNSLTWDRELWRIDTCVGVRLGRHWQAKLEYDFSDRDGPTHQGQQLVAVQLTAKF